MTDWLDSLGDTLGGAAKSVGNFAESAFDFVTPHTSQRGAGWGFGDLMSSLGDLASNSTVGAVGQLDDMFGSEASWQQKLFMGGMTALGVGGAVMGARQLAAARSWERQMAGGVGAAPAMRVSDWGRNLGLAERVDAFSPAGQLLRRQHPGLKGRAADIITAPDTQAAAHWLMPGASVERVASAAAVLDTYADMLTDIAPEGRAPAAQLDFAKIDTAVNSGLIVQSRSKNFHRLWSEFMSDPLKMSAEKKAQLLDYVRQFGDVTRDVTEPDLSFDLVSRIEEVQFTPDGVVLGVTLPRSWDRRSALTSADVRSARLQQINVRVAASHGLESFRYLLDLGLEDQRLRSQGLPGVLPAPLDIGTGWYPKAGKQIDEALARLTEKMPWIDKGKLTAAVSFSSEAEQWEGNIALAVRALTEANRVGVQDAGFQDWLRSPEFAKFATPKGDAKPLRPNLMVVVDGKKVNAADVFDQIHEELTNANAIKQWEDAKKAAQDTYLAAKLRAAESNGGKVPKGYPKFEDQYPEYRPGVDEEGGVTTPASRPAGVQLSKVDLSKILRLVNESADDVFRSTSGRKQKSFYLNLMGDTSVVTVDRHQHDAFFGLATSSDFKVLEGKDLGDSVYDLIQDTVFQLVDDYQHLGLTGSDVQGVVWEVWRILKNDAQVAQNGLRRWSAGNPFRIVLPGQGENPIYKALMGEIPDGPQAALNAIDGRVPFVFGEAAKSGLQAMPDGSLGFVWPASLENAAKVRHLSPALDRGNGTYQWALSAPRQVADVESLAAQVRDEVPGVETEQWPLAAFPNGHWGFSPQETVVVELADGQQVPAGSKNFETVAGNGVPGARTVPARAVRMDPPGGLHEVSVDEWVAARNAWEQAARDAGTLYEFGTSPIPDNPRVDLKRHRLFVDETGTSGFAIAPDGDLQQVFRGVEAPRGFGEQMVKYAMSEGAVKLDAYDQATMSIANTVPYVGPKYGNNTMSNTVEMMPVSALEGVPGNNLRYDPTVSPGGETPSLADSIQDDGFKEPLILNYYTESRTVRLTEGNHRLAAANDAGLTHVPVRVLRVNGSEPGLAVRGFEPNEHGYVPGSLAPSQVMDFESNVPLDGMAPRTDGFNLPDYYARLGFTETERFRWNPAYDTKQRPAGPSVVMMVDPSKTGVKTRIRKVALKPAGKASVMDVVKELREQGYQVDAVYGRGLAPEGFKTVREHSFTDGVNLLVARSADPEFVSPHGVHAWVPEDRAKHLPISNPFARVERAQQFVLDESGVATFKDPNVIVSVPPEVWAGKKRPASMMEAVRDGQQIVFSSGPPSVLSVQPLQENWDGLVRAVKRDGRIVIEATASGRAGKDKLPGVPSDRANQWVDAATAVQLRDTLLGVGVPAEKIELRLGDEPVAATTVVPKAKRGTVTTIHSFDMPAHQRIASPLPELLDKYGLQVGLGYRVNNKLLHLDPVMATHIDDAVDRFMGDPTLYEMFRVADLRTIGVSVSPEQVNLGSDAWLWAAWGEGGSEIAISGNHWNNYAESRAEAQAMVDSGFYVKTDDPVTGLVLHELGHVAHEALRRSFRTAGSEAGYQAWEKSVLKEMYRRAGGKRSLAQRLSQYGAENVEEMVAEAFSEVLGSPSPRPFAREVFEAVTGRFAENRKYNRIGSGPVFEAG